MKRTFLRNLCGAKSKKDRNRMINKATKCELNSIRNVCYNVCKGKYKLPTNVRRRLVSYKNDIRDLANKKKLKSKKGLRKRLTQRGGFLPSLIPAVIGVLSTVGSKLVERAVGV